MKHVKTMTTKPLPAQCPNAIMAFLVGLIAEDQSEYASICYNKRDSKA